MDLVKLEEVAVDVQEASLEECKSWLRKLALCDGIAGLSDEQNRRKYKALSTIQFAENVPKVDKVDFLQKIEPYTAALAIE